ncbi:hypothetical protein C8A05DRAFT_37338, partial [Staphylotrichum tortipilum]
MDALYRALPLGSTDIRLLTIDPTDPSRPGPVHCTLTTHSLTDFTPAYTAFLSHPENAKLTTRQLTTRWKHLHGLAHHPLPLSPSPPVPLPP